VVELAGLDTLDERHPLVVGEDQRAELGVLAVANEHGAVSSRTNLDAVAEVAEAACLELGQGDVAFLEGARSRRSAAILVRFGQLLLVCGVMCARTIAQVGPQ